MRSLLVQIRQMLEDRADIELFDGPADTIQGCQIRRFWKKHTIKTTFSEVESEAWEYVGCSFLIQLPHKPKAEKMDRLSKEQQELYARLWKVGCQVIFPDTIDDVLDYIASEPENIEHYFQRRPK